MLNILSAGLLFSATNRNGATSAHTGDDDKQSVPAIHVSTITLALPGGDRSHVNIV
jgi:hypothetical protein